MDHPTSLLVPEQPGRLIAIVAVTAPDSNTPSPVWADIGYPGADSTVPADPGPISTLPVVEPSEWDADVVVVGVDLKVLKGGEHDRP